MTPYRIATPRLMLRCWEPADAPALKRAVEESRDHLARWLEWARLEPTSLEEKVALCRRYRGLFDLDQEHHYAVTAEGGAIAGSVALTGGGEVGYWIHAGWTGRGVASEAVAGLCRAAFAAFGLPRLFAHVHPENGASLGVMRRVGFVMDAVGDRLRFALPGERRPEIAIAAWDAAGGVIRT